MSEGFETIHGSTAGAPQGYASLLGSPIITVAGQVLTIPRRQVRALFYRLAVRPDPVPRATLCTLFWPETPEPVARRNLTRLLSYLRGTLPEPAAVVTMEDRVYLDPVMIRADTHDFEVDCASSDPERLQQAVERYRGPFLVGASLPDTPALDAWLHEEQRAFEQCYLDALSALIEVYRQASEYDRAVAAAQAYLNTDEVAEDVHRRLIDLYARSGKRDAALRQFERCAMTLERELGVRPLPETRAVYEAVRTERALSQDEPETGSAWTTLSGLDLPLIGREPALAQLRRAYERAGRDGGSVVLVSGEAGVGKSHLLQAFVTQLGEGPPVLAGAAHPDGSAPFQLIADVLRPAVTGGTVHSTIDRPWLAEASRLLPELRSLYPALPAPMPMGGEETRLRLFEALHRLVLGCGSGSQPIVLCLDDLHWADSTSYEWVQYFVRRITGHPVLVVGTYRMGEHERVAELRRYLRRRNVLSEVVLDGLGVPAIVDLLHARFDEIFDVKDVARRLHRATGGNPFYLIEILQAFVEAGHSIEDLAQLDQLPLTSTVQDAVTSRLDRLSPAVRQILEAGAVIGRPFTLDVVQRAAGRPDLETVDSLDELVARRLLLVEADTYRFQHEIIRTVVYRNLSYWRRRLLHRRAGEVLAGRQADDVSVLAWHFKHAEELRRAAEYTLAAGRQARNLFADEEARAYFEQALALLKREEATVTDPEALAANRRFRIQVLYERGWALRLLGEMGTYEQDLEEVARLAGLLGDYGMYAHLSWRRAYTHRWFCRYEEARVAARAGVRQSRRAGDDELEAISLREVGMAAREVGDFDTAEEAFNDALAAFRAIGTSVYEIHVLCNLSTLDFRRGNYDRALAWAREALACCEAAGLPLQRRLPLGDMGAAAAVRGDYDQAERWLRESLEIARQIGDRTQEILMQGHLGWLHYYRGAPGAAIDLLRAALDLAGRVGSCTERSWLYLGLAHAHHLAGDREPARRAARCAATIANNLGRTTDEEQARRLLDHMAG